MLSKKIKYITIEVDEGVHAELKIWAIERKQRLKDLLVTVVSAALKGRPPAVSRMNFATDAMVRDLQRKLEASRAAEREPQRHPTIDDDPVSGAVSGAGAGTDAGARAWTPTNWDEGDYPHSWEKRDIEMYEASTGVRLEYRDYVARKDEIYAEMGWPESGPPDEESDGEEAPDTTI